MVLSKPQSLLSGIFLVAFLTDRLEVDLEELCVRAECFITGRTGEVVAAPGLAQSSEDVTLIQDFALPLAQIVSMEHSHWSTFVEILSFDWLP